MKRVQEEGTFAVKDGIRLITLKEFRACSDGKKAKKRACVEMGKPLQRRCRCSGEARHNLRTCRQEATIDFE
jgi:hypothetical protein